MTKARWWANATETLEDARRVLSIAENARKLGRKDLVDAAYWAASDALDEIESAQGEIPYTCADRDGVMELWQDLNLLHDALQEAKDDLVSWADAHDYTITR